MKYEKPCVTDLGSIVEHTWNSSAANPDQEKGGGIPQHLDWACEWSSGSGEDRSGTHPGREGSCNGSG